MGSLNFFDINNIIYKFNIEVFIETGTLYGDTVEFCSKFPFTEIHSIEIIKELADKATERFISNQKIKIHHGNSVEILKSIIPQIKGTCLFWLDAHFPGVDSRHKSIKEYSESSVRLPLKEELQVITQRILTFKDVIIMDDLWIYEDGPYETGLFNDHMKKMGWNITRQDIWTGGVNFVYDLFNKTHDIKKDYRHQGYITLYPK